MARLVAGGRSNISNYEIQATAEVYDPATGTWSTTGSMATWRESHTATLLPNGKVLVAGGQHTINSTYLATAEEYSPSTGQWSAAGSMYTPRLYHTATPLPNGKVLIVGGRNGDFSLDTVEVYDPAAGRWSRANNMTLSRHQHAAAQLPNGKVLASGGVRPSPSRRHIADNGPRQAVCLARRLRASHPGSSSWAACASFTSRANSGTRTAVLSLSSPLC